MPSKIEWTDYTLNPIVGCSPVSVGCVKCYAKRMAKRLASMGLPQYHVVKDWDGSVYYMGREWFEGKVAKIPTGSRVFICSMGDIFHENVKPEWVREVFEVMRANPQLKFKVLTKRAERIREVIFSGDFLLYRKTTNIQVGVTTENQEMFDKRYPSLDIGVYPGQSFVSCEPLLGPIDFGKWKPDWVIVGGETGPGWRYMTEEESHDQFGAEFGDKEYKKLAPLLWFDWATAIHRACQWHDIPRFFKKPPGGGKLGKDGYTLNTPEDLKVRQWPKGTK